MAEESSWYGDIGQSLMDFAGSGTGQTLIGGGAGYLADKYVGGGDGKVGAMLGAGAGAYNAYDTGAGLLDPSENGVTSGSLGGLLGKRGEASSYTNPVTGQVSQQRGAGSGLLGMTQDINPVDAYRAYGEYRTGESAQENAKSEIDYRNRIAQLEEDEYNYKVKSRAATQAGADEGFANSSLSNYYTA